MKQYHPTDSRYRGPSSPTLRAKSTRPHAAAPRAQATWTSARPSPPAEPPKANQAAAKPPFWVQFLPPGFLVSGKHADETSGKASPNHWGTTVFKIAGGLLLYAVLSQTFDGTMVSF